MRILKNKTGCFLILLLCAGGILFLCSVGVFNGALIWLASKIDREWEISQESTIYFYDPQWACDNICPPFVIVDINDEGQNDVLGTTIRVFQDGNDLYKTNEGPGKFFACQGSIKKSLYVYVWEYCHLHLDGLPASEPVTGRFFDALYCEKKDPTPEQHKRAMTLMKQYTESGEDAASTPEVEELPDGAHSR